MKDHNTVAPHLASGVAAWVADLNATDQAERRPQASAYFKLPSIVLDCNISCIIEYKLSYIQDFPNKAEKHHTYKSQVQVTQGSVAEPSSALL